MEKRKSKSYKEDFDRFFETPTRESFRQYIKSHLGETDYCDFKREWPSWSKLARHALALANSGGGCLIIGVEDNNPIGLEILKDKADVYKGLEKFVPTQLVSDIAEFEYESSEYPKLIGKRFQVFFVEDTPQYIPFIARADGEGIRRNAIYTRRGTNSEEATYETLQQMFNRRLETGYSSQRELTLEMHLAELKTLYDSIPKNFSTWKVTTELANLFETIPNPSYPLESREDFINKLIEAKKEVIRRYIYS